MRRSRPPDEEILGAVAELVDDGAASWKSGAAPTPACT